MKYCKVCHFADDTNHSNLKSSIKNINKQVIYDLKHLSFWLNANKICLKVGKTEVLLFKSIRKSLI